MLHKRYCSYASLASAIGWQVSQVSCEPLLLTTCCNCVGIQTVVES